MDFYRKEAIDDLVDEIESELRDAPESERGDVLFTLVDGLSIAGDFARAERYAGSVNDGRESAELWAWVAKGRARSGEPDKAMEIGARFKDTKWGVWVEHRIAEGFAERGEVDRAIGIARGLVGRPRVPDITTSDVEFLVEIADVALKLERPEIADEALALCRSLGAEYFDEIQISLMLAADVARRGDSTSAAAMIDKAIDDLVDESPETRMYGAALAQRTAAAIGAYRQVARAEGRYRSALPPMETGSRAGDRALMFTVRAQASFGETAAALKTIDGISDPDRRVWSLLCLSYLMARRNAVGWETLLERAVNEARALATPAERAKRLAGAVTVIAWNRSASLVVPCALTSLSSMDRMPSGTVAVA